MPNGMKPGQGDDPFADDGDDDDTTGDEPATEDESAAEEDSAVLPDEPDEVWGERQREPRLPWIHRRDSTKSDRSHKAIFLQDETLAAEDECLEAVAESLGEDVQLTDLREAVYLAGLDHPNEVADKLREWGYDYES